MTAALTPDLALDYLSELSADIRAAIVLDAGGDVLAVRRADAARVGGADVARAGGEDADAEALADHAGLADAARDFLAQGPVVRALTERGGAFGARDDRHAIVVATGPLVLPSLAIHDIRAVLAALGGAPSGAPVSDASPASAEALLNAL
jgi:hypothetical protein